MSSGYRRPDWDTDTYNANLRTRISSGMRKVLETAERTLNRAWHNFKERNCHRTIRRNKVIALDPNLTLAYTTRGMAHNAKDEFEEAEKDTLKPSVFHLMMAMLTWSGETRLRLVP